jgi:hypothetical protein
MPTARAKNDSRAGKKTAAAGGAKRRASASKKARKISTPRHTSAVKGKGSKLSGRMGQRRETLREVNALAGVTPLRVLKYRRTGYKCVADEQKNGLTGMHPALKPIMRDFDYDRAKANGNLQYDDLPPSHYSEPVPSCIERESAHDIFNKSEGQKLDRQVGQIVAWHKRKDVKAPLLIFFDQAKRVKFFATGTLDKDHALKPYMPVTKDHAASITKLCKSLLPETMHLIKWCHDKGHTMEATQVCVSRRTVGTMIDLVLKTKEGRYMVIELKRGCKKAFGEGKRMTYPLQDTEANTHNEYMLQTMMSTRCFRDTYPTALLDSKTPCMLIRLDSDGLHQYIPSKHVLSKEEALASLMRC